MVLIVVVCLLFCNGSLAFVKEFDSFISSTCSHVTKRKLAASVRAHTKTVVYDPLISVRDGITCDVWTIRSAERPIRLKKSQISVTLNSLDIGPTSSIYLRSDDPEKMVSLYHKTDRGDKPVTLISTTSLTLVWIKRSMSSIPGARKQSEHISFTFQAATSLQTDTTTTATHILTNNNGTTTNNNNDQWKKDRTVLISAIIISTITIIATVVSFIRSDVCTSLRTIASYRKVKRVDDSRRPGSEQTVTATCNHSNITESQSVDETDGNDDEASNPTTTRNWFRNWRRILGCQGGLNDANSRSNLDQTTSVLVELEVLRPIEPERTASLYRDVGDAIHENEASSGGSECSYDTLPGRLVRFASDVDGTSERGDETSAIDQEDINTHATFFSRNGADHGGHFEVTSCTPQMLPHPLPSSSLNLESNSQTCSTAEQNLERSSEATHQQQQTNNENTVTEVSEESSIPVRSHSSTSLCVSCQSNLQVSSRPGQSDRRSTTNLPTCPRSRHCIPPPINYRSEEPPPSYSSLFPNSE